MYKREEYVYKNLFDIVDDYFEVFLNEKDKLRDLFFSGIQNKDKRKWVDRICLYPLTIDNERFISDSVEMLFRYLFS